jgi:mono/diheme cytochrome c family protein
MHRTHLVVSAFLLASLDVSSAKHNSTQDKPKDTQSDSTEYKITPEDIAKKNPIPPAPAGLAEARKLYGYHCAMCHGADGDGKGELAVEMKLQLNDWRDASSIAKISDGELFYIVSNGKGKMLGGEGDRTPEKMRWNLVNLVHSFAKKESADKAKAEAPPK